MFAVYLEDFAAGTQLAAAFVDPEDKTATVELLERLDHGWKNLTLDGELTTSIDMAMKYDDAVITRLPPITVEIANSQGKGQ